MRNPLILGCVAAAVALAAGCGSSSSKSGTTSAAAAATTAAPAASTSAAGASGVTISVKHSKDGTILAAGPKHMTVYLFEADKGGKSACSGACAGVWPPVTTGGAPQASGSASSAELATVTRSDGTRQVTYNGHPIYFFEKDGDAGDAYGQGVKGFGADWYVMSPGGNKIDNEESSHGSSSTSS